MPKPTVLLLRGLEAAFRALPTRAALGFGRGIGFLLGRVIRHRRALVLHTLARCLPERAAEAPQIADAMYRHFGLLIAECLHFSGSRAHAFVERVDIVGREHVEAVRARGGGALVLMGHIGNWELMGLVAAAIWRPVHVVVKSLGGSGLDAYWRASRERMGLHLLPRDDAMRDCIKALRRREVVALILDQNMRRHRGIFVDFFGQPACTTPGLAYLSGVARTPVLPVYMIRAPNGRHTLHIESPVEPPPDRSEDTIRVYTQRYTAILERIIRAHPDQWTWIHKRWRTRPPADQEGAASTERK